MAKVAGADTKRRRSAVKKERALREPIARKLIAQPIPRFCHTARTGLAEYSQTMTQRQEFRVLEKRDGFEVREYQPCVIAEVQVSAHYSSAASSAFGSLFRYIAKGNTSSEKIAMTAPVIAAQRAEKSDPNEWFISFVMPSGSTYGRLPHPNDPQVKLRELDTEVCVALSFRGKATEELSAKKTEELRAKAAAANIALSDETRICRFDPPFKPGFLQYNEIVIPAYLGEN